MTDEEAYELAETILGGMDMFAVYITKTDEAELDEMERDQIIEPLARMIKRLSPRNVNRFRTVSDPALLAIGLGMYFARFYPLLKERQDAVRNNRLSKRGSSPTGQANSNGFQEPS